METAEQRPNFYTPVQAISVEPSPPPVQNYIICTKCGHNNPANSNFCTKCGTRLIR